jgi:hypothetical protein
LGFAEAGPTVEQDRRVLFDELDQVDFAELAGVVGWL